MKPVTFSRLGRGIGQHPGIAVLARNRGDVHLGKNRGTAGKKPQRPLEMRKKWLENGVSMAGKLVHLQ